MPLPLFTRGGSCHHSEIHSCGFARINYLAHLYLSGDSPGERAGALLGDFVKGPVLSDWPTDVAFGIRLHRRVDV